MISTRPLDLQGPAAGSRCYVRLSNSLDRLQEQSQDLTQRGAQDSCSLSVNEQGLNTEGDGPQLPLKLGELKTALHDIEQKQSWLTDREGVSIYRDNQQRTHIDVVNFGGFILAGDGRVASSSVNAW